MKKYLMLLAAVIGFGISANAQLFKKVKTINVEPDNAKIIIGGMEVATGSYALTMGKADYTLIKLEAPGYISKSVKVFKNDSRNTLTYKLELDDSYSASDASSDLANKRMAVIVKKGMSADEVWKRISYYVTELFPDLQIQDKSAGWVRSAWVIQQFNYVLIRTRIEIKEVPGQDDLTYTVTLSSEYAWNDCGRDDQCFKQWDRVLKKYKQSIEDLVNGLK
jgi:hypothetical protein